MATTSTLYAHFNKITKDGTVDLDTDPLKLALVTSAYTPSAAHTQWADVSANEVTTGSGYTTGGETLANVTITNTAIDADDVVWTALNKTFRYAVLYANVTRNGLTDPVLGYILYDDTPADVSPGGLDLTTRWDGAGIVTLAIA